MKRLLFITATVFVMAACHPIPRDMRQAACDALENARVQLDSDNKAEALQLFKDAEHYGLLADDTMTVARARYQIGYMLYRKGKTSAASNLHFSIKTVVYRQHFFGTD